MVRRRRPRAAHPAAGSRRVALDDALDDERDSIPFAIDTYHVLAGRGRGRGQVPAHRPRDGEVARSRRTPSCAPRYRALVSDYEEKLAQLKLQTGVAIRGRNPASNQVTIRRTSCRRTASASSPTSTSTCSTRSWTRRSTASPQIDVAEAAAEGAYVRFFEQAFEWEHMSWVTYPYFWGSKDQWDERLGYDDPDPAFVDFLQAGFARVSVPATARLRGRDRPLPHLRRDLERRPLPTISSPLYLPIADEIAERLDRPGDEVPQGDPWTVRVPTSLVKLRADDAAAQPGSRTPPGSGSRPAGRDGRRAAEVQRWVTSHGTGTSSCSPGGPSRPSSSTARGWRRAT